MNAVLEELDKIRTKLPERIEQVEKLAAKNSQQLENQSTELKRLSEQIAYPNNRNRTEKGINLFTLKHEIFMQQTLDSMDTN